MTLTKSGVVTIQHGSNCDMRVPREPVNSIRKNLSNFYHWGLVLPILPNEVTEPCEIEVKIVLDHDEGELEEDSKTSVFPINGEQ